MDQALSERMRADWNERAREDARYYVAFGRRDQDDAEFLATAADVIRELEGELKRFPAHMATELGRALEIGCGPGRLMLPMSRHFGEIHGVDVSDEMIRQAEARLASIRGAQAHHTSGADLGLFPEEYFDYIYSYAVFQHIPSAEIVFSYLREAVRVLKPGGIAHLQLNGLPRQARTWNTWEGARISGAEVRSFAARSGVRLLELRGEDTQYMWVTLRKPGAEDNACDLPCVVHSILNTHTRELAIPSHGPMSAASLLVGNLPEACDLISLEVLFEGAFGRLIRIGPAPAKDLSEIQVLLPRGVRTGIVPVTLLWNGREIAPPKNVRIIAPGPAAPRLKAISDAVDLLSYDHISSGRMKATIEDVESIDAFVATVDGIEARHDEPFLVDPLTSRYEVNFWLPPDTSPGGHVLEIRLGTRLLTRMGVAVVATEP